MAPGLDYATEGITAEGGTNPYFESVGIRAQTLARYFAPLWIAPLVVDPREPRNARRKDGA
jgi:hypothetical protein